MSKPKRTVVEYRSYRLSPQFPVLLLSGEHWKISDIPSGRLHFHNCLEIGICHSESGTMEICGRSYSFQKDDVTVIPRNIPHTTYSAPGTRSQWSYLYIDPYSLFKHMLPASWKNWHLPVSVPENYLFVLSREEYPHIHSLMRGILEELTGQLPCYQYSAKGLLLSLYIDLHRIQAQASPPAIQTQKAFSMADSLPQDSAPDNVLLITPALDYIENHYMEPFTMEYLAELCHWSPTHFRRVFQEIMGTSPLEFLNSRRILASCDLLRFTDDSILDISEAVGFRSVSSFNRCFLKIMRVPPP